MHLRLVAARLAEPRPRVRRAARRAELHQRGVAHHAQLECSGRTRNRAIVVDHGVEQDERTERSPPAVARRVHAAENELRGRGRAAHGARNVGFEQDVRHLLIAPRFMDPDRDEITEAARKISNHPRRLVTCDDGHRRAPTQRERAVHSAHSSREMRRVCAHLSVRAKREGRVEGGSAAEVALRGVDSKASL